MLGLNATAATTEVGALKNLLTGTLLETRSATLAALAVRLRLVSVENASSITKATIALNNVEQVVVQSGTVSAASGPAQTLPGGLTLLVTGSLQVPRGKAAALRLVVEVTDPAKPGQVVAEPWLLKLSG